MQDRATECGWFHRGRPKVRFASPRPTRQNFNYDRELRRRVTYDHAAKSDKGKYPHITEEERIARAAQQDTALQSDDHWKEQLKWSHYFPAPEDSPANFSYRVASSTYAVPYHVVGPMTWEYHYHSGQAQEDLSDHLVPASLYGLKVTRPGYCSADDKPATTIEAQAAFDGGRGFVDHVCDTDVNPRDISVGQVGRGHYGAALFVCVQPECTVARGHELLFATVEQWAAHWNSFHVAAAPAFNCMVRGCNYGMSTAPDALDSLFRHFQDTHPDVYNGGKWTNLTDFVIRGLKIRANAQYWPPTNTMGKLQRPVAVTKPTPLQLGSPIVAARWAAREAFHKAVVAHRRSYKKAKCRESKSGEHSSSASKSGARAQSESDAQTLSESADEWTKFHRTADEAAAATSSPAKAPGPKKGKGSKGSASLKDSKSLASAVAKAGSAKGSKRKGKEAGLVEKPRWETSYKIPKRSLPDTSVSSGGHTHCKADKSKWLAKKSSKSKPGKDAQAKSGKGSDTAPSSTLTDLPIGYWANHSPGDDTIPSHAERVEWAGGLVLFRGTRHHPWLSFEAERQAQRQANQRLRLWRAELVQHERESLDSLRGVGGLVFPEPATLPRLPPWAAPNGWDYWGRPWAYMDAPSGHSEVGVSSTLSPPSNRETVAVLVDCPHEPQFLPDMLVAQSAAVAAGRAMRQARPLTQKGEISENMTLETAARRLLPRTYGNSYSVAVLEQLKAWESFRTLNIGRRKNPTMPRGVRMLHLWSVPEPSFMERHLKLFQGVPP